MKLRNRKLAGKDDGATPSQQNFNDKIHQNSDEDIMIVSICEDNGDVEIIASKDKENSGLEKKATDDDLILVEEISCSSQGESNPRKRKRTDDEDVKVLNCF
jgi:hypothetical protein